MNLIRLTSMGKPLTAVGATLALLACGDVSDPGVGAEEPGEGAASVDQSLTSSDNPGARGPHAVTSVTYGADSQRSELDGVLTEHLGQVHFPSDMHNGSYPLVLMQHGQHLTCMSPSGARVNDEWPCEGNNVAIESYRGYDYLADLLASHGMVVASISANGMNAADSPTVPRELLFRNHMNQFDHYNAFGEDAFNAFPGVEAFEGMVDMDRVALIGHSRGGTAALSFVHKVPSSAADIRAIVAIAPTNAAVVNNIPVALLHGYCDGDIDRMPGLRSLDGARYSDASDQTEKYTFIPQGANHNFFNDVWSPGNDPSPPEHAIDDAHDGNSNHSGDPHCDARIPGNGRLNQAEQQALAKVYVAAFLRRHLNGEHDFDPVLKGDVTPVPAPITRSVQIGFHAGASDRRDINTLADTALFEDGENQLGGSFELEGFQTSELCDVDDCLDQERLGHRHQVLHLTWNAPGASFENQIPASAGDVRQFQALQFRVGTDHTDARNPSSRDFRVVLRDSRGRSASVRAADFSNALDYPPGADDTTMTVMSTVRIPLSAFSGVSQRRVRSVEFVFDESETGGLLFSDLAFSD